MYCFKIFYTLKPSTHIKINFKITPTCFGPTGPSSGSMENYIPQHFQVFRELNYLNLNEYYDDFYLI